MLSGYMSKIKILIKYSAMTYFLFGVFWGIGHKLMVWDLRACPLLQLFSWARSSTKLDRKAPVMQA